MSSCLIFECVVLCCDRDMSPPSLLGLDLHTLTSVIIYLGTMQESPVLIYKSNPGSVPDSCQDLMNVLQRR